VVAVFLAGFTELFIIASNLGARHRAEALLSAIQHIKLGQSHDDLQWLLKQYHATRSGPSSSTAASLFSPAQHPVPNPDAQKPNTEPQLQDTYLIDVFPRTVNKIAAFPVLWHLGVQPWAVEVRLDMEEGRLHSLTYSAGFGTISSGARKELIAIARLRDHPSSVPYADYTVGYDIGPSFIAPRATARFRFGAVITSNATNDQRNSAFNFNLACFSTIRGCSALCETLPDVWKEGVQRSLRNEIALPADELENPICH
jgi:hypothetical protein